MTRTSQGRFVVGVHAYRPPQPHWQRSWLEREYVEFRRSASEIAAAVGCTKENIEFWLRKHGIPRRAIAEARAAKHWGSRGANNPMFGKTGAANPNYIDGSAPLRQRLYARGEHRAFLQAILRRDGFRCRRCCAPKRGKRSLHVHHVAPWAGNESLRFEPTNALTLCRSCHSWVHSKANIAREYLA